MLYIYIFMLYGDSLAQKEFGWSSGACAGAFKDLIAAEPLWQLYALRANHILCVRPVVHQKSNEIHVFRLVSGRLDRSKEGILST